MSDQRMSCTDKHMTQILRRATRAKARSAYGCSDMSSAWALALLLTATSFFIAGTDLVWQPSIPVALIVLAIAQMGVHLVFFLHITTGPDNTNNVLALAFGLLIVFPGGRWLAWIMAHLNQNMMPMDQLMQMQRLSGPKRRAACCDKRPKSREKRPSKDNPNRSSPGGDSARRFRTS